MDFNICVDSFIKIVVIFYSVTYGLFGESSKWWKNESVQRGSYFFQRKLGKSLVSMLIQKLY